MKGNQAGTECPSVGAHVLTERAKITVRVRSQLDRTVAAALTITVV
jgi:hypothetical protein